MEIWPVQRNARGNYGASIPEGRWANVTIGPGSLIESVLVNGTILGEGGVVALPNGTCTLKGVRPMLASDAVSTVLELALWAPGETPVPTRLAPTRDVYPGLAVAAAAWVRRLVVPFGGRDRAAITMSGANGVAFEYAVHGRRAFDGGEHVQTVTGTFTPSIDAVTAKLLSAVVYVGGEGDLGERFDQLEVWYRLAAATFWAAEIEAL